MELLGKQTCFVQKQQQRTSSTVLLGSSSYRLSSCCISRGASPPPKLLLLRPRISVGVLFRSLGGKCRTDCRLVCRYQKQGLARPRVETPATISAGWRRITSARRRSTLRRPEGNGGFNVDLELEILAFMLQSGNYDAFPTKEELISSGRLDLVEAIVAEGGWLASGWEKKANASVVGDGIQDVSHSPFSRQRHVRNKSKAVPSPRRPRGRPKLAERRSLSIKASPGEHSGPDESQEDAITGQRDDQKTDSPRDGNGTDGNGTTKLERVEKNRAGSSFFERVRKEPRNEFPSSTVGYKLWEFESLAAFIEYRKNGSMQRQQMGLCNNSSVKKKRLDPEAAKGFRELCERRCDAVSELRRKGCKSDRGTNFKRELDTAYPAEQDIRVDDPVTVKADLDTEVAIQHDTRVHEGGKPQAELETSTIFLEDTGVDEAVISVAEVGSTTTIEQDTRVDEAVSLEAEVGTTTTIEQDTGIDEALDPEAELDTATTIEQETRVDEVIYPQAELDSAPTDGAQIPAAELDIATTIQLDEVIYPQAELYSAPTDGAQIPAAELDIATTIQEDTRVDEVIYPQAELDYATTDGALDSIDGEILEDSQAYVATPVTPFAPVFLEEVDLPSPTGQDPGVEEAPSSYERLEEASTVQEEVRETIVEVEGKLKEKKKKKRQSVKMEESEDVCKTTEKLSEALDWINQMVEQREKWMLQAKSSSEEGHSVMPKSIQGRIRSLEDKLSATRTALQSGREALGQSEDGQQKRTSPSDVHTRRLAELQDASDELEYTENKILKLSSELASTRREVAALEGARGIEITEVRNAAGENEKKIEKANRRLEFQRAARIVWPHPAREVFVIGSFDDWNEKIKMELSGAGVFVVSLPLPPGRYEIKFIVDGTWRVDTGRPIVYVGGYENNVLIIPEQFTFDRRK